MRTLKYAILGLLNRGSMTGYDLSKEFNSGLVNFWHAKHSQIYPELKKLVDENLISFDIIVTGEVLEKKLYTITKPGQKDLLDWLTIDEDLQPTPKDTTKLRIYFSENMTPAQLFSLLNSQLTKRQDKLAILKVHLLRYHKLPTIGTREFGDYMVLSSALIRENAYIEWLNECLSQLTYLKKQ